MISPSVFQEENFIKNMNNDSIDLSVRETNQSLIVNENDQNEKLKDDLEKDYVDYGLHSFITGSRNKFPGLAPPVAPRRSRQNSAFSSCSARYAS